MCDIAADGDVVDGEGDLELDRLEDLLELPRISCPLGSISPQDGEGDDGEAAIAVATLRAPTRPSAQAGSASA